MTEHADHLIAEVLVTHRAALIAHVRRLQRGPAAFEPEDIVQTAALDACRYLRRLGEVRDESGLIGLLKRCAETALQDQRKWQFAQKRRAAAPELPVDEVDPAADRTGPGTAAAKEEAQQRRRRALLSALQSLPPLDRRIVQMRMEDPPFTFAQIGELVGMDGNAVRMRHTRAAEAMRPHLERALPDDSLLGERPPEPSE